MGGGGGEVGGDSRMDKEATGQAAGSLDARAKKEETLYNTLPNIYF